MRIGIVLGTRPEIIKLAPVIEEVDARGLDRYLIHTNQHYDWEMDAQFFEEMELPPPTSTSTSAPGAHGEQTAKMLAAIEAAIEERELTHLIVQGDTNSGLAGALAAAKLLRRVAHVEAGLRSYDMRMPEELNRRLIDHISTDLFPPTPTAHAVLVAESVPGLVHEAERQHDRRRGDPLRAAPRGPNRRARPDDPDDPAPARERRPRADPAGDPRCRRRGGRGERPRRRLPCTSAHAGAAGAVRDPLPPRVEFAPLKSFRELLGLQASARLVMTDSGGLQEESCVLGTPCVVLRTHTDRPETEEVGASRLGGVEREGIVPRPRRCWRSAASTGPSPSARGRPAADRRGARRRPSPAETPAASG